MKPIEKLHGLGQSLWYDNIQRSLLDKGEMAAMIERGEIRGVTSNPTIFHNAIVNTDDYDSSLKSMAWAGLDAEEIFWNLAVKDIQDAADLFLPLYMQSNRKDGYVSLEVNPRYAGDTAATVQEARGLWKKVNRPNLMIKIPATTDGIPAIRETIANGINVNVTLIFSNQRYESVIEAFFAGLEDRLKKGKPIEHIASVASFFISRVDSKVDGYLRKMMETGRLSSSEMAELSGKAAIANAKMAYQLYQKQFQGERFSRLIDKGAQNQRPLWASTSTKNSAYRDVRYIEELIGAETVNTVPPATLVAFKDHGKVSNTIESGLGEAHNLLQGLKTVGISMEVVTKELEQEGVKAFIEAFDALITSIKDRREAHAVGLSTLSKNIGKSVSRLEKTNFVERLKRHDPSLWSEDQKEQNEICERMDWIQAPWQSEELLPELEGLLKECRRNGFTHALLMGMGGSSLAPEVMSLINGQSEYRKEKGLVLRVLDSTNPDEVKNARNEIPLESTLFIVASKSGTTGEISAFYKYFWDQAKGLFGEEVGSRFIAITDPDTKLEKLARENGFWKIFTANPKVGGRNSALTAFGLVPAALIGFDIRDYLDHAQNTAQDLLSSNPIAANSGVVLGAVLAEALRIGKDKLIIVTDDRWSSFGSWLEQLIAESSGKNGEGIIPVAAEPRVDINKYLYDRLFVYIRETGESDLFINQVRSQGHPVIILDVESSLDLGSQFYLWEIATATACSILGVNSFNQPDVQDAKTRTLSGIETFKKTGKLEDGVRVKSMEEGDVYSNTAQDFSNFQSLQEICNVFLKENLKNKDYVAINAFIPRTEQTQKELQQFRSQLVAEYGNAVTLGFGPRFLHSTGQLHKGGPNSGVFIEITADPIADISIPGEGITFGTLALAQALGDYQALNAAGRRILRIHLKKPDISVLLKSSG
ncbi:MAG: bifunctional transaldolase/phosoglucose isomerase [Chloroflexi bacterium]|nr:bifunctional transaldolase/phosoglucose isomerase [Chloroflexota bacterium]